MLPSCSPRDIIHSARSWGLRGVPATEEGDGAGGIPDPARLECGGGLKGETDLSKGLGILNLQI